jgi:hypothetical protein
MEKEMHKILLSKKKTQGICGAMFLVGLAILAFTDAWWPGIMLVIGLPLAIRQYAMGRFYDMGITLIVFGGVFFIAMFGWQQRIFLPVLFIVGAIYVFFREYFESTTESEEVIEEELNEEIEEDQNKR